MKLLLDTNVISELHKPRTNQNLLEWYDTLAIDSLCTSSLNIAELVYGAEIHPDLIKRRVLLSWIEDVVRAEFVGRIYEITESVLVRWRVVARHVEINMKKRPATDLLIAAVALENNLAVATRDVAPFVACGVPTLNPWTNERFNGA